MSVTGRKQTAPQSGGRGGAASGRGRRPRGRAGRGGGRGGFTADLRPKPARTFAVRWGRKLARGASAPLVWWSAVEGRFSLYVCISILEIGGCLDVDFDGFVGLSFGRLNFLFFIIYIVLNHMKIDFCFL